MARASWCRLLLQCMRAAASRIFCTAGSSSPIKMAMMAMTTSSSINVKADRLALAQDQRMMQSSTKALRILAQGGSSVGDVLYPQAWFTSYENSAQLHFHVESEEGSDEAASFFAV